MAKEKQTVEKELPKGVSFELPPEVIDKWSKRAQRIYRERYLDEKNL